MDRPFPRLIVRFKGQQQKVAAPPTPPSAPSNTSEDSNTDFSGLKNKNLHRRSSLSASSESDSSQDESKTKQPTKKSKNSKKPSLANVNSINIHSNNSCVSNDESQDRRDRSTTPFFIGSNGSKRKRHIPKSIGGGKGDLKPPSKKYKPSPTPTPTSTPAPRTDSAEREVSQDTESKKEEKRVLRSQDTKKEGRYDDFFRCTDDVDIDIKMLIDLGGGDKKPPPRRSSPAYVEEEYNPNGLLEYAKKHAPLGFEEKVAAFTEDPLSDEIYKAPHVAKGRLERRSRNVEREKLAHNAQQLRQDIENLRNPEWMRLLGIGSAAVANLPKKEVEKKHDELLSNLEAIVEKHKSWEEDERRKRTKGPNNSPKDSLERDTAEAEDHEEVVDIWEVVDHVSKKPMRRHSGKLQDRSDIQPEPEFTSFYPTASLRQQALSTEGRKSSRNLTAFGQPLPTWQSKYFALSDEIIESSRAARAARARRRLSQE